MHAEADAGGKKDDDDNEGIEIPSSLHPST
jgi:hypothetical protein